MQHASDNFRSFSGFCENIPVFFLYLLLLSANRDSRHGKCFQFSNEHDSVECMAIKMRLVACGSRSSRGKTRGSGGGGVKQGKNAAVAVAVGGGGSATTTAVTTLTTQWQQQQSRKKMTIVNNFNFHMHATTTTSAGQQGLTYASLPSPNGNALAHTR